MEVTLAVLADYANTTGDGKLNIMGVFDMVRTSVLPARLPQMRLVFIIEAHYAERDRQQAIEIVFQDPDGKTILGLQGAFVLTGSVPGEPLSSHQILELTDTPLFSPGVHLFSIFVNNSVLRQVKLNVLLIEGGEGQLNLGE
ncbi:MAG TPA: hypothetical protein VGB15_01700 [Longimicrobium sp.]|jgi:hypothetical protein